MTNYKKTLDLYEIINDYHYVCYALENPNNRLIHYNGLRMLVKAFRDKHWNRFNGKKEYFQDLQSRLYILHEELKLKTEKNEK